MKKKIKYKLNNNLLAPFCLAVFICLLGAFLNSYLFYNSFLRALTKLNEEPIAKITFKYKTAQRKFLDRVVWDRLRQNSPVYNGDTIHTSSFSEATIWFVDGNVLDLSENTMAQVFLSEDKRLKAELSDGSALVDSSDSGNGMTLSSGGVEVSVDSGSALSASGGNVSGEGGIALQVIKGNASVKAGNKEAVSVSVGEEIKIDSSGVNKNVFTVTEPAPNSRILYYTKDAFPVKFNWKSDIVQNDTPFRLSIYSDKNLENRVEEIPAVIGKPVTVELNKGKYYWTVTGENFSAEGRFQLIQSLAPALISPVENYSYYYRSRNPSVRLIWTESEFATAYKLEISDSPRFDKIILDQRSSTTSSIISTLSEGKYWWRVTPFYTINRIGFSEPSKVSYFVIEKKSVLRKPVQLVPVVDGIVNTEPDANGVYFSWKQEDEAVKYNIKIADNPELNKPVISEIVEENYFTMKSDSRKLKDGKWFWAVSQLDFEGNESASSEVRPFFAFTGKPNQHTIEPQDGFRTAYSLMPDTRFTWRRNLPETFETSFEIARDSSFDKILVSRKEDGNSDKGFSLKPGTYYWRLVSSNGTNGAELITPVKSFTVLDNLPSAKIVQPEKYKVVAREIAPVRFEWEKVPGADYYKFTITQKDGALLYENTVYDSFAEVDMYSKKFSDKTEYHYQVQAMAMAIPGVCSRRTGNIAEKGLFLHKLRPIEIISPGKDSSMKGDDVVFNPIVAEWNSVDDVKEAQFILYKTDVSPKVEILKVPSEKEFNSGKKVAPKKIVIDTYDGLRPGNYEIIVKAKTMDGIDVSNTDKKYRGRFSVLPIAPLEIPTSLVSTPSVFDVEYLKVPENPRQINLSWKPVSKATEYQICIKNKEGRNLLYNKIVSKGTSYKINFNEISDENKALFSSGTFTWSVQAIQRIDHDKDGVLDKILKDSPLAYGTFSTNIPSPKRAKGKKAANPYGN